MLVFFPASHHLHSPQWYVVDGTVRPCPDNPLRIDCIRQTLQQAGHTIIRTDAQVEDSKSKTERPGAPAIENPPDPWPALRAIHTPGYLHYLQTIHTLWTAEFGPDIDVLPDTFPRFARAPAQARPAKPAAQAGYYCFDTAAPITAGTWTAALDSARCALRAAQAILEDHPAAYALCRPPGHHAGPDYCGGFCYLNNAALTAQHLLLAGKKRAAILDLDYHHGNGTQDIFYSRSDVLFVSLHADPNTQYPYFWGYAAQTGADEGLGFTRNFPLPRGTGETLWLDTLARALDCIASFAPEALIVSLGTDTHEKDPVGDFAITLDGYDRAAHQLHQLHLPTVLIQEGGYNLETVGPCVAAFLNDFR